MSPLWPSYEEGSLALISSICAHFGAPTAHTTLPGLDRLLATGRFRNVVLMLYDGLGIAALKAHLPADSFLRRHLARDISASYPSTTTAATTALESGLSPAEHGWLGWSVYFPELDRAVDLFPNTDSWTGEKLPGTPVAQALMPYMPVYARINAAGQAKAAPVSPYSSPAYPDLTAIEAAIRTGCEEPGRHYFYGYWNEPDNTMHERGVLAPEVHRIILDLDRRAAAFAASLPRDTLLIITADHGLVDAENLYIEDHPALMEAMLRPPAVESRAAALYVKPEYRQRFPRLFEEAFGGRFLLMTGADAIAGGIFGPGVPHPRLTQTVGDYMAFALTPACLLWKREPDPLIGVHAGLTADEMLVPLIIYEPDGREAAGLPGTTD